ncbi:DUF952 domain-containing protein [Wukongibacter baidiensis]|uniref:DUF952 domain-containing protein n=1 Tax=Wukongibacter baidiensis TaxID=1723361 RepID=UPI003D7F262D
MIIYTATVEEWEKIKKQKEFISENFDEERFIHCSFPNQTLWVLNKHYKSEEKVILLCINPGLLKSNLVIEDLKGRGEEFPHIYGSVNVDAIEKTIEIYPSDDGKFYENGELKKLIKE